MNLTSPKNWKMVKLGDVANVIPGYAFKGEHFGDIGVPIVKITEIQPPYVSFEKCQKVETSHYDLVKIKKYQLRKGDYVVAMTGATIGKVGKIVDKIEALLNQRVAKIEAKEGFDNKYVYYQVFSDRFFKYIQQVSAGSSAQQNVSGGDIEKFEVAIPESIDEQREIAAILGSLDDKIELLRGENKTLESIVQALFREWFVDFNFPGATGKMMQTEMGEIPEEWKLGKIYDLMKVQYGFPFKSEFFNENKIGLPLIRIRDLKDGDPTIYTNEECGEEYIIKRGDIVAGMDAEFRPCIWKGNDGVLNQRVCKFTSNDESVSNYFIYQVIKPHLEFFERTKGGTTVSHLGKADLDSIEIVIPTKEILLSFSKAIESSYRKIINNFLEIQTLSRLRDELLNKIFN